MNSIATYQNLKVKWPLGAIQLENVEIQQAIGKHATLSFTGRVSEENGRKISNQDSHNASITLVQSTTDRQAELILFAGQIQELDIRVTRDGVQVGVNAISHTYQMDTVKKNRSFRLGQSYVDVVKEILASYPGGDQIDHAFLQKQTARFIMQYEETDWEFLMRLASHVGATLIPDIKAHKVRFWIGLPESGKFIQSENHPFEMKRSIGTYWNTTYDFESDVVYELGDELKITNDRFVLIKRCGQMTQGIMKWQYECIKPAGIRRGMQYNQAIIGAAIDGKVIEVKRNQVKLHLDMDERQEAKDAQWFPYSAEGNQVWYMMPEKGAKVKLYFPSGDEDEGFVIQSVRHEPQGSHVEKANKIMADPRAKSFGNPQGKSFSLKNEELEIIAQEGLLYVSLNSYSGVTLGSASSVHIQSSSQISLSGGNVTLTGSSTLNIGSGTDSIDLSEAVNVKSKQNIELETTVRRPQVRILSAFEQEVAEKSVEEVRQSRMDKNTKAKSKGYLDSIIDFGKDTLQSAVDIVDIVADQGGFDLIGTYGEITGQEVKPFEERNETWQGMNAAFDYLTDTSIKQMAKDATNAASKKITELVQDMEKEREVELHPVTSTEDDNYAVGQIQAGRDLFAADVAITVATDGGGALSKAKYLDDLSGLRKVESGIEDGLESGAKKGESPHPSERKPGVGPIRKGDSPDLKPAESAKDGKLKTNAKTPEELLDSLGELGGIIRGVIQSLKENIPYKIQNVALPGGGSYLFFEKNESSIFFREHVPDEPKGSGGSKSGGAGKVNAEVNEAKTLVGQGQQFTNGRKNKLKPNIRYKTGEYDYFYETDNVGRISKFETDNLQLTKRKDRLPHSKNTPGKIKGKDDAGHLAGDRFGGSPKIDNLVSQLSDVNQKQYKKIENQWAAALNETPPKKVTVDVEIVYSEDNMRPEKFVVNYTIDGKPGFKEFVN